MYETERLWLKPSSLEDAPFILALLNTPDWLNNIGDRQVRTLADAKEYIQTRIMAQFGKVGYGNYTLIRKADQAKVGVSGLYLRDGLNGADIGFALLPDFYGKGYASEATRRVKELAFQEFGLAEILGITTPKNVRSQRVLEGIGMAFQQLVRLPDDPEELMLYQLSNPNPTA